MLELVRRIGVEKRWVYGIIMGGATLAFVGGMGMVGMSGPGGSYAAKINGEVILLTDYQRVYRNQYQSFRDRYGENWDDELVETLGLRMRALSGMIDHELWSRVADDMGIAVSDRELREEVTAITAFHVNNRFNSAQYRRVLKRARMTAEGFETSLREDILADKARDVIRQAAVVTPTDLSVFSGQDEGLSATEKAEQDRARRAGLLNMKQSQLVAAYSDFLRQQADIEIFMESIQRVGT